MNAREPKTIKRLDLYGRVWQTPVVRLAGELRLSDTGLTELCQRNYIPVPPRGYWNLLEENRKARRPPLDNPELDWDVRYTAAPPGTLKPPVSTRRVPTIVVPDKLNRPHPLLRQTRHLFPTGAEDEHGRIRPPDGCLDILVTPGCRQRAYRIMDTVLKTCVERGWTVRVPEKAAGTIVNVDGGEVAIELMEALRREPRDLNEREKRLVEERGRPLKNPVYAHFPSGRLVLTLDYHADSGRQAWREGSRFRLEELLDGFVDGLAEAGEARKRCDRSREEDEARRREEERNQADLELECKKEQRRVDELLANADTWDKAEKLRAFIKAYVKGLKRQGTDISPKTEVGRWIQWANAIADRLDPMKPSPPSILNQMPDSFWNILGAPDDWWKYWYPPGGGAAAIETRNSWWRRLR